MNQDYPAAAPVERKRRRKWTDKDQVAAEVLQEAGLSCRAIARLIGCSSECVRLNLRPKESRAPTAPAPRKQNHTWTTEDQRKAERLRGEGSSYKAIAQVLGASWATIRRYLSPRAREEARAGSRARYYTCDQEARRTQAKAYRQRHEKEIKARSKAYYRRNRLRCLQATRNWVDRNREAQYASHRAWRKRNPEIIKELNRRHRAEKQAARRRSLTPLTLGAKRNVFSHFSNCCAYCCKGEDLSIDHVLAISRGGLDEASNIVPACRTCNSMKNSSDVETWYRKQVFFSELRWRKIREHCPFAVTGQISLALPL